MRISDWSSDVCSSDLVMFDFLQAGEAEPEDVDTSYQDALSKLEDIEFKNMLSAEEDQLSAVVQITAGAGGTESCDWAGIDRKSVVSGKSGSVWVGVGGRRTMKKKKTQKRKDKR